MFLQTPSTMALAAIPLVLLTSPVHAFWRMSCGLIQTGRIDPIVSAGTVGTHVHKIAGASSFNVSSTFASLQASDCTSCSIQADKSAYWTPQLYYQHANTTLQTVPNSGMTVYYLGRGDGKASIVPFPPGLRMLSGDPTARALDNTTFLPGSNRPVAERVSFACLDRSPSKETTSMVRTACANGLRAQVHFQSCWNGRDLYLPDNSHVAYMSGLDNGRCPPTHPVQFIHLFYEVLYSVADIKEATGGRYVFSNGDPTGFGFHGDFMNGWDTEVLTEAIRDCVNTNDGAVENCKPLAKSNVKDVKKTCPEREPVVKEQVKGFLPELPGCVKVVDGPGQATEGDMKCAGGEQQPGLRLQ